ncbi:MerR family transcriptional regulator [Streptomyces sp. NPDC046939]|uniref:MerR family transcriptional regulator n=1 Tax=Streptomyces sp. NPDC046939 TaxID=3155376 RepID=UPI0033DF2912
MRIGDAAAATGTTPRALRFYEERGLLPPPRRTATGQRDYAEQDLARIRVVRQLLSLGLTVADVRACADRIDLLIAQPDRTCTAPVPGSAPGIVQLRIDALDAEIERLTTLRARLAQQLAPPVRPGQGDGAVRRSGPVRRRSAAGFTGRRKPVEVTSP